MEPFLLRALIAGLGVAAISAPLGCFVVWNRMAYFGETIAQAGLIGVALGLLMHVDLTAAVLVAALAAAGLLVLLSRQKLVPLDTLLGLLAHAALAVGVIATSLTRGPSLDVMGYLFGDIFAVTLGDLAWIAGCGALVAAVLAWAWQPLLAMAVSEELAAAEGVDRQRMRIAFVAMLAVAIAVAIKIVGVLLAIAFLIMPAAAARPLSTTPEQMLVLSAVVAFAGVAAGLALSFNLDVPGGPAIVVVQAALALTSLAVAARRTRAR